MGYSFDGFALLEHFLMMTPTLVWSLRWYLFWYQHKDSFCSPRVLLFKVLRQFLESFSVQDVLLCGPLWKFLLFLNFDTLFVFLKGVRWKIHTFWIKILEYSFVFESLIHWIVVFYVSIIMSNQSQSFLKPSHKAT